MKPRNMRIEVFPTRRFPGWAAVVWGGVSALFKGHVYYVFFGKDREDVTSDAEFYILASGTRGVE